MKKVITLIIGCMLAMAYTVVSATEAIKTASATTQKALPQFLFVIQAQQASIKKIKPRLYQLTFQRADGNRVLMFSSRPYRIAKIITEQNLATLWKQGHHSFQADPPNAALVIAHKKAVAIELVSMRVEKNSITFAIKLINSEPVLTDTNKVNVELFIDAIKIPWAS